ncbi:MAG: hypothetical protein ACE5KE_00205 [Methanosarcinales archaeon]
MYEKNKKKLKKHKKSKSKKVKRTTDLLYGITTVTNGSHWLFCDFDDIDENELLSRVGNILFDKYNFSRCYLIKSSEHKFHLVSFSRKLKLETYLNILKELGCDKNYIKWVKKVKYGVLRISRRSVHKKVPKLYKILVNGKRKCLKEYLFMRDFYFMLLNLEGYYKDVKKVVIETFKT